MPVYGIVFSRVMTILTVPTTTLDLFFGEGYVKNEMAHLAIYIIIIAISSGLGTFT